MGCGYGKYQAPKTSPGVYSGAQKGDGAKSSTCFVDPQVDEFFDFEPPTSDVVKIGLKALMVTDSSTPGKVEGFYALEKQLGVGSFGAVHQAIRRKDGAAVAVKTISKGQKEIVERGIRKIKLEIEVMQLLDHPNILRLHETFEDRWAVSLVLELCRAQTLGQVREQWGGAFDEPEAAMLMAQLLEGVSFMHQARVCHRDLKLDNLLFAEVGRDNILACPLKIADFGLACRLPERRGEQLHEKVGCVFYVAPEVILGPYGETCDLWSCGVILHVLLTGRLPFVAETESRLKQLVLRGDLLFDTEAWSFVTNQCKSMLRGLLERDLVRRLSAEQAAQHPWIEDMSPRGNVNLVEVAGSSCPFGGRGSPSWWGCTCACQPPKRLSLR